MSQQNIQAQTEKEASNSQIVVYGNVELWGGELEGIIVSSQKYYSLKTVQPIKLDSVKVGEVNIGDVVKKANIGLESLEVDFVVEYKGDSSEDAAKPNKDNYTKVVFEVKSPKDETKTAINKDNFLGPDFKIKSLKVAYLNYGEKEEKQKEDFQKWIKVNAGELK